MDALQNVAAVLFKEPEAYKELLQAALKNGASYPAARHAALLQYMTEQTARALTFQAADDDCSCGVIGDTAAVGVSDYAQLLSSPNNILGIEYCKALMKLNSGIRPYTIRREGGAYNDASLTAVNSSALAIRNALADSDALTDIQSQMPAAAYDILQGVYRKSAPVLPSDMSVLLHYQLLLHERSGYTRFLDVSEELSNRIGNKLRYYKDFDSFCELLKTKEVTYTRVSRALLHILLGMTKENMAAYTAGGFLCYARMLGFRKESAGLLSVLKQYAKVQPESAIPLISKLADAKHSLSEKALAMLDEDIRAAHIYNAVVQEKFGCVMPNEYVAEVIRV